MAIVAKRKAQGGRRGTAWMPQHTRCAWLLVAVLCVGAAAWLAVRGRVFHDAPQPSGGGAVTARENDTPCDEATDRIERKDKAEVASGSGADPAVAQSAAVRQTPLDTHEVEDAAKAVEERPPEMPEDAPPEPAARPTGFSGGAMEQILGMMASANDRSGMPPMPAMSEAAMQMDLMTALTNDIVIFEDDSPETVAFKEKVAEFKSQLAEIAGEGGSIEDTLREYENWINENKAVRDSVIGEYRRLKAEASQEEADAYLAEANKELEAEGIETVKLGAERRRRRHASGAGEQPAEQ